MSSPFADPDAPNKLLGSHYASLVSAYASVGLPVPEWVAGYFTPDQVAYGQQTLTQGKWGDPNDPDWVMERWADAQIERREGRSQEEPPGDQTPPPGQGHSFIGGFDVEGALGPMGDQELYEVGSALFGMLSTRAAKANAQSAYGDYFEEPGGEF